LGVVAEGIEDHQALQLLLSMGCRQGQGYVFGRPVPAPLFPTACVPPGALSRAA
jgi:EAL domain-containing protein (putative c-di-GMP-specific phosphodiesterase class I)